MKNYSPTGLKSSALYGRNHLRRTEVRRSKNPVQLTLLILTALTLIHCSPGRRILRDLKTNPVYAAQQTGVSLYDPATGRYLIQHNANRPFTPASNTKLFSVYAGLLTLSDSLPVLRYVVRNDSLIFWGTGNPLLLHPDLPDTTALAFLRNRPERLFFSPANYTGPRFGAGWAWDDYADDYSPELTSLPIYGNVVRFGKNRISPHLFADSTQTGGQTKSERRAEGANRFVSPQTMDSDYQDVPFRWSAGLAARLLADTLHRPVGVVYLPMPPTARLLRGTPTDSLYKRMLVVSDNLFAEQIHFMTAAERASVQLDPAGERNRLVDSVLHYPAGLAKWADGSGLSRYNLFTPNILIDLLKQLAARVPQKRLFALLPVAGRSGTLRSITLPGEPYIFAKSGSMSGVYNLSGYLITKRGKLLYFSVMNNNFTGPVSAARKQTGALLKQIHEQF